MKSLNGGGLDTKGRMSKVRINDLARELEVKSRAILDALTHVGVTEKKTHSSSLEGDEAERVRQHFHRSGKNGAGPARVESEPKQKIDWSRVSKPGDVLKAIQQRKDEAAAHSPAAFHSAGSAPGSQALRSNPSGSVSPRWRAGTAYRARPPPRPRRLCRPRRLRPRRQRARPAKLRPAKASPVRPGQTRAEPGSGVPQRPPPAAARSAKDCSPAPAGAADCGGPTATCPGNRSQAARWAGRGQAAGSRYGSASAGSGARDNAGQWLQARKCARRTRPIRAS